MSTDLICVTIYRCPSCKRTRGILPDTLLPFCRWFRKDIQRLGRRLFSGESTYRVAKSLGKSLAALVHLNAWILKAGPAVSTLTREAGFLDPLPPRPPPADAAAALALSSRWFSWPAFTHAFSRVLYPKRFPLFPSHVNLTG